MDGQMKEWNVEIEPRKLSTGFCNLREDTQHNQNCWVSFIRYRREHALGEGVQLRGSQVQEECDQGHALAWPGNRLQCMKAGRATGSCRARENRSCKLFTLKGP
jgi:hypothetical protein